MQGILRRLGYWINGGSVMKKLALPAHDPQPTGRLEVLDIGNPFLFDQDLLDRSRTQWQLGDWESLGLLEYESLQRHPDRAPLALLAAAGKFQLGEVQIARQFVSLALNWGCSRDLLCRILASGAYNSMGRAAAINGQQQYAVRLFEKALTVGTTTNSGGILARARAWSQFEQIVVKTDLR